MLGIAIHCIQHSQAILERGVCELAHSFFHSFSPLKNNLRSFTERLERSSKDGERSSNEQHRDMQSVIH